MSEEVSAGDRISYGWTQELLVDGDKAWPKAEVNIAVRQGESGDEAFARANALINDHLVANIEKTAAVIVAANRTQRGRRP